MNNGTAEAVPLFELIYLRCFRPEIPGMFISSRYLATVRREMGQFSWAMRSLSFWSERGLFLSSSWISLRRRARAAVPPRLEPRSSAVALREKK